VFETTEEAAEWRVAMETAIADALGDDTIVSKLVFTLMCELRVARNFISCCSFFGSFLVK
jgi:hypothetical protein